MLLLKRAKVEQSLQLSSEKTHAALLEFEQAFDTLEATYE
jgi:hypothetical protein